MTAAPLDLRALVAEMVREVVAETVTEMVGGAVRDSLGGASPAPAPVAPAPATPVASVDEAPRLPGAQHVTPPDLRTRSETVRLASDADLDAFVRRLLGLFENPKNRQDLKAGRLRFHLGHVPSAGAGAAPAGAAVRVETGAVTERQVAAAAEAGRRLVLGKRAVLTPLGREKARALGVPIEKER